MSKETIAIVGLGLIGGSVALSLIGNPDYYLVGIEINPDIREKAVCKNAVHSTDEQKLSAADIIVLATTPEICMQWISENIHKVKPECIITDVCGVKRCVVSHCEAICIKNNVHFVGAHPMAGKERGGFEHADSSLFRGCSYIITPTANTANFAFERVKKLAYELGAANITISTPDAHDEMIAFTSQLPHVLSGAYVRSPKCENHVGFSAGSFRDVSRVAAVDENLWTDLFVKNHDNLSQEIGMLIAHLEEFRGAIADKDFDAIYKLIKIGRQRKEGVKYD